MLDEKHAKKSLIRYLSKKNNVETVHSLFRFEKKKIVKKIMRLFKGKYLSLVQDAHWEYATRENCTGVAVIVPITEDKKVILVEQYRIPVKKNVIEFAAGLIGDTKEFSKETLEEGAKRELLEETGFEAKEMIHLTSGPPSSGLSSEIATFFKATGLKKVSKGGGDKTESIIVHEINLNEVDRWLKEEEKKGKLVDPKVYAGLYFLKAPL